MDARFQRSVAITVCTSRMEAELKRSVLDSAGIVSHVASDDVGGLHPEMGYAYCGAHRLVVGEDQADEARELLQELADAPPAWPGHPDDEPGDDDTSAAAGVGASRVWFWIVLVVLAFVIVRGWLLVRAAGG